ncbi:MAG TPA: hypothetical protein PK836_04490 [Syntrophales bacterium]|nr:hypothetical protein [Syntrophales bacterium]HOM06955.1 hypothetical protein [Syntrophales bacterium]HON98816.1 hypothetical protein [Syntrophales bacterium]HPC00924.1 hypothetical protein [Syntrophales bacterium]HPQ06496.1 hypothetical protein [Syntrophales bacterium]
MIEDTLERLAERILSLDEASLTSLWEKYRRRMENFTVSREWERSVIIFFIINAVRAKNQIFNERIMMMHGKEPPPPRPSRKGKPVLRLVKPEKET